MTALKLAFVFVLYVVGLGRICRSKTMGPAFDIIKRVIAYLALFLFFLHLTDGLNIMSRAKKCWWMAAAPLIFSTLLRVSYHAKWDIPLLQKVLIALELITVILWPYAHFRAAAESLGSAGADRRGKDPAGAHFGCHPLAIGVVDQQTRPIDEGKIPLKSSESIVTHLQDGPPTLNAHLPIPIAFVFVILPRLLQAKMESISAKLVWSVLISLMDLLSDLSMPFWILLYISARRFLRDRRQKARRPCSNNSINAPSADESTRIDQLSTHEDQNASRHEYESMKSSQQPLRRQSSLMDRALAYISAAPSRRTINLQAALASLDVLPRYLRALSDQIKVWSLTEVTALLSTHLIVLVASLSAYGESAVGGFLQGVAVLAFLVFVECLFETVLFVVLVRWWNLPMVRGERESGSHWCRCLMSAWVGINW
ncbi:unnamed protein product [Vitrella brassicaformis CCMP3155]|uniref:Uncharacterized protein n=1 Tax=Vitrella brassicaformis (strain CCMP3155) TaxID=1169540 RepID=A0A0G4EC51_VITBC|nr:unnamed protein product [Vitrella brassicaformis CCMP3155]|eukprot:CEL93057.1 unnamed protein product [Vitrella brassicaformis CCMP3155]